MNKRYASYLRTAAPRRWPMGDTKNFERVAFHCANLCKLSEKYAKEVPRKRRSYNAWLRFLRRNGAGFYAGDTKKRK